jgi:hypothetical protein
MPDVCMLTMLADLRDAVRGLPSRTQLIQLI